MTCATDWLDFEFEFDQDGFLFNATTGQITCTEQSECLTFEERYGNGEGLCNTMWASSFSYSDQDNVGTLAYGSCYWRSLTYKAVLGLLSPTVAGVAVCGFCSALCLTMTGRTSWRR